jgi:hypothetical protein
MDTSPRLIVAALDAFEAVAATVAALLKAMHAVEDLSKPTDGSF